MQKTVFDTDHLIRTYFKMAIPGVMGLVITLVYNLADTFFVAQTENTSLVAGVSLCAPVFTALMGFGNIYGQGGNSLISRLLGQQDGDGTARVSSFCFYAALGTGVVLAVLMLAFCSPLLRLLGATEDTLPYARQYYLVLAVGAPLVVLNFIHSNLVRSEGMAAQSMLGNALGTVVNIILDPIMISGMGMGAFGAALATIIGYACSVVYFLILVRRRCRWLSYDVRKCRVSGAELCQVLGVGATAAITNLMQSLALIVLNQFLVVYGSAKIAAMGIVQKVIMIAQLVITGFAFGGVPLYGYLYGAGRQDLMRRLIRFCLIFLSSLAVVFTIVLFAAAPALIRIFMQDADIIADGTQMLRWQVSTTIFAAIVLLLTVLFQATGQIVPAFLMSLSRQGVIFLAALVVCMNCFGYTGVLASQAVADVLSAALGLVLYARMNRQSAR